MLSAAPAAPRRLPPAGAFPPPPRPDDLTTQAERDLPTLTFDVLLGLGLAGVFADLALRTGLASVAGSLAVVAVAVVLLRSGSVRGWLGRSALVLAVLLSLWLPVRSSPWLVAPNVMATIGLLIAAVMVERLDPWSITLPRIFGLLPRLAHAVFGPVAVVKSVFAGGRGLTDGRPGSLFRGVAIAVVPVTTLVALLASADAVFASLFSFATSGGQLLGHALVAGLVAVTTAGLLVVAHVEPSPLAAGSHRRWLGGVEATVLLLSMVVVYGAFVLTQVVTALGGASHVLETAGLTQAEYARSGFFQMLAAAAMTLALLFIVQTYGDASDRRATLRLRALSVVCSLLTIGVVGVSISRLSLYAEAFGLTMLRLYSTVFAGFVGVVFILFIIDLFADGRADRPIDGIGPGRRAWFLPAVGLAAWCLLMGLNGSSPEAIVSDHNLEHRTTPGEFDAFYAASLSTDATPALLAALADGTIVNAEARQHLDDVLCHSGPQSSGDYGLLSWNRSRAAADIAAAELCAE